MLHIWGAALILLASACKKLPRVLTGCCKFCSYIHVFSVYMSNSLSEFSTYASNRVVTSCKVSHHMLRVYYEVHIISPHMSTHMTRSDVMIVTHNTLHLLCAQIKLYYGGIKKLVKKNESPIGELLPGGLWWERHKNEKFYAKGLAFPLFDRVVSHDCSYHQTTESSSEPPERLWWA